MLTWASILVWLAALVFIFSRERTRNLFRFFVPESWGSPWNQYYLAIPALTAVLAWYIARRCANRPGPLRPRIWVLLLASICTGIAVWGLVDRFILGSVRGSPLIHGASAASLMAVLTLAPRLITVFPYHKAVQHIAPIAFTVVLFLGLPISWWIGDTMISLEQRRVEQSAETLRTLASNVRALTTFDWSEIGRNPAPAQRRVADIHKIELTRNLPDSYVWAAARTLNLVDTLHGAVEDLGAAVVETITHDVTPRLNLPRYKADRTGERWERQARFADAAAITASYYREARRLMQELEKLKDTPASDVVKTSLEQYAKKLEEKRARFDQHWLATLSAVNREGLEPVGALQAAQMLLPPIAPPIGDFAAWKTMPWEQARQLMQVTGCADRPTRWSETVRRLVPDEKDPSIIHTYFDTYQYFRVECYSYLPSKDEESADMMAQLHLVYKSDANVGQPPNSRPTFQTRLYFEMGPGSDRPHFQSGLMQDLAAASEKITGNPPQYPGGTGPSDGFRGPGYSIGKPRVVSIDSGSGFSAVQIQIQ